jgi:hypothetical protein
MLTTLLAAAVLAATSDTIAIIGVHVIPMSAERIDSARTVIIADGRILAVEPDARARIPRGARIIEGRGRYLLPGLVDMHVHLTTSEELGMYPGYGVLAVRDLNGSPQTLAWRDSIARRSIVGPRLFVSGPMLSGPEIPWRNKVVPSTAAEAVTAVRAQHDAGYDQIKLYDGLTAEAFVAAVDEARRLGVPTSGHIPAAVGFDRVLASGMTSLEHLDKTVFAVLNHNLDTLQIPGIARRIKAAGIWVTPTLASMMELSDVGSGRFDSLMARPEARAAPAEIREFWSSITARMSGNRRLTARYNPWTDFQIRLARELHRVGVTLLAGSDLPNAVLVPGYSLHEELAALREAGLRPFEALRTATIAPAIFFGQERDWGTVEPGRRANLVLVDANPLETPEVLRRPWAVVLDGQWLDSTTLARLRR